jgi:hypothetical protein
MKTYTMQKMIEILKMYEENNFNLNKTSKDSGVARQTIRKWADMMGVQVFSHNKINDLVFKVDEKMADRKARFENDVMDAKELLLARVVKRIPKTNDMDSLSRGLKILNELDRDVKSIDPTEKYDTSTVNYIQILMDQLNIKPYEPGNA